MRRMTQKGECASCDVGRDKDAESPRNAVDVFVANEVLQMRFELQKKVQRLS